MLDNAYFQCKVMSKIEKMGLFLVEKIVNKKCPFRAQANTLSLCQSAIDCPNFLRNKESTNFYMGFLKKNFSRRSEKVDFLKNDVFCRTCI